MLRQIKVNTQKVDFTYSNYNNLNKGTSIYKANLDHCLYRKNSNDLKIQCNIVDDPLNTSDHRYISLDIFLSNSFYASTPRIPDVFGWEAGKVDFSDQNLVKFYQNLIDLKLTSLKKNFLYLIRNLSITTCMIFIRISVEL